MGYAVDLIVKSGLRKSQQFLEEDPEPRGFPRQAHFTLLDAERGHPEAGDLVACGSEYDGMDLEPVTKILNEDPCANGPTLAPTGPRPSEVKPCIPGSPATITSDHTQLSAEKHPPPD